MHFSQRKVRMIRNLTIVNIVLFGVAGKALSCENPPGLSDTSWKTAVAKFAYSIGIADRELTFGDIVQYVGFSGKPVAECISLQINGRPGYAFVSTDGRLLEFSTAPAPHLAGLAACEQTARNCAGEGRGLGKQQFIYAGTSIYLVRIPVLASGKEIMQLTLDLRSWQVVDGQILAHTASSESSLDQPSHADLPSGTVPVPAKNNSALLKTETRILDGMPHLVYHISDGATSVAAILTYWEKQGAASLRRPSLQHSGQLESDEEFIAQFMAAGCGCNLSSTLEQFLMTRGYELKTVYRETPAADQASAASYDWYRSEINAGHPALVVFSANRLRHTMIATGYSSGPYGNYLVAVDQASPGRQPDNAEVGYYLWDGVRDSLELTVVPPPQKKP